jgi:hypothetical protein
VDKLVLGVAALALSARAASAQWVYPGYGFAPYGYGYAGWLFLQNAHVVARAYPPRAGDCRAVSAVPIEG